MNKFIFLGRVSRDVETKVVKNDKKIATFSIAVNRNYVDNMTGERPTDFFNITAYDKIAEFCSKYVNKGRQYLIEGRIQNRTWEDQDGQKKYATDYILEKVYFADSKKESSNVNNTINTAVNSNDSEFITIDDPDELPF